MGSMEDADFEDDDSEVFERTVKELDSFGYPEGATSLRSVRATLYRHTKTCHRGKEQDESFDCTCLLYTSPSPRDRQKSRMPSSA